MITTMNTSTVSSLPIEACTCSRYSAHITPPRPARPEPTMNTPEKQPPDAIAERFHHLAVFHAGADQQPDLGPVQHQLNAGEHDQADQHRQQAVFRDRDVADDERAAQRRSAAAAE